MPRADAAAGSVFEPETMERISAKLLQVAWFRYRIPREQAEDVLQTAFAAFLSVRHRYEVEEEHPAILVGIFRKKCLEHIDRSVREKTKLRRYCNAADSARENPWIRRDRPAEAPSVIDELVRREDGRQILEAIAELRPTSRKLFALILRRGLGRKELIDELGINKNTLDSRLHVGRRELRGLLRRRGVDGAGS